MTNVHMNAPYRRLKELDASVIRNMPTELPSWWVQRLIENPKQLQGILERAFTPPDRSTEEELAEMIRGWEVFYKKVFKKKVDLSGVELPPKRDDFDQLVFVIPGLTLERVVKAFDKPRSASPVWWVNGCGYPYSSNNRPRFTKDEREVGNAPYAIRIRGATDPDTRISGGQDGRLVKPGVKTMTLMEYLIYGLKTSRFLKLDEHNETLCSGSVFEDGTIPCVKFRGAEVVGVHAMPQSDRNPHVRAREVITVQSSPC